MNNSTSLAAITDSLPPLIKKSIPSHLTKQPSIILAQLILNKGAIHEAKGVLELIIREDPDSVNVLILLSSICSSLGLTCDSRSYYKRQLEITLSNHGMIGESLDEAVAYLLAAHKFDKPPDRVPVDFVNNMFDRYAGSYDQHLKEKLSCTVPDDLALTVTQLMNSKNRQAKFNKCVDLGCGTGLAGHAFSPIVEKLLGVDLSLKMLEKCRHVDAYDELVCEDILDYLENEDDEVDLFIAADVFNYFGDLRDVLFRCRKNQQMGGFLAFSLESSESQNVYPQLTPTGRYQHSKQYLFDVAKEADYHVDFCTPSVLRTEQSNNVNGYLCVLIGQ